MQINKRLDTLWFLFHTRRKRLPAATVRMHGERCANKSQIPNTNDLNYFDFSSIDENIFFNSFSELECPFFKIIYGFVISNSGQRFVI
jgi:hypothetical protein